MLVYVDSTTFKTCSSCYISLALKAHPLLKQRIGFILMFVDIGFIGFIQPCLDTKSFLRKVLQCFLFLCLCVDVQIK